MASGSQRLSFEKTALNNEQEDETNSPSPGTAWPCKLAPQILQTLWLANSLLHETRGMADTHHHNKIMVPANFPAGKDIILQARRSQPSGDEVVLFYITLNVTISEGSICGAMV